MVRKVTGVLALAGFVWLLALCFSSPSTTYRPFGDLDDGVTVKCEPLLDPNREPRDPDDLVSDDQQDAIDRYADSERREDENNNEERLNELRAKAEQVMLAGCENARLDRLANLGFVAFITLVPILIALRPGPIAQQTPRRTPASNH